ncbi:uncharacterized protein LY89DRAFT_224927 [Mollisia scopiformis]|uniref:Uncharacterized protein n=1 Tax=Mollisia scopiformis TaxID=149040 RepID=A0A194WW72_MOLSC|nr:uncharacterized protein LY89DRAFT_224927 [Mollisia scopiformis]KUJ12223.1 hypothetical protein LY89DRAFT_224927 [Mollisia scopiformis]
MSPTAFKQQLLQLIAEIEECHDLCQKIRRTRSLGSTHESIDLFQKDILPSALKIEDAYRAEVASVGSRMDLGDETARSQLNRSIRDLQLTVSTRLAEIASPRRHDHVQVESPGFKKLRERWWKIIRDVLDILSELGRRLSSMKAIPPGLSPEEFARRADIRNYVSVPDRKVAPRSDEMIVKNKDLEKLMSHMKNSWVEIEEQGLPAWQNAFDAAKIVFHKPSGFIQPLSKHVRFPEPEWRGRGSSHSGSTRGGW